MEELGDHPVVVGIGIIGVLVGLGYTVYDHHLKQEDPSKDGIASSKVPSSVMPTSLIPPVPMPIVSPSSVASPLGTSISHSLRQSADKKGQGFRKNILGKWKEVGSCSNFGQDRREQYVQGNRILFGIGSH